LNELCKFPGESAKRYALQAKLQTLYLVIGFEQFCLMNLWHSLLNILSKGPKQPMSIG
jgi:hypothetical protein